MNEVKVYSDRTEDDNRRYAYEKAIEAYWKHVDRYHTWMNYYAIFNGALFVGFCTLYTATSYIFTVENYHLFDNWNTYLYLILSILSLRRTCSSSLNPLTVYPISPAPANGLYGGSKYTNAFSFGRAVE